MNELKRVQKEKVQEEGVDYDLRHKTGSESLGGEEGGKKDKSTKCDKRSSKMEWIKKVGR